MAVASDAASTDDKRAPARAPISDGASFGLIAALALVLVVSFAIGQGNNGAAAVATVVFFLGSVAMYLAPAMVAVARSNPKMMPIAILNLLLGWTVLGWVGALVWAYSSTSVVGPVTQAQVGTDAAMRACPFCAEPVRKEAIKCKHCGSDIAQTAARLGAPQ